MISNGIIVQYNPLLAINRIFINCRSRISFLIFRAASRCDKIKIKKVPGYNGLKSKAIKKAKPIKIDKTIRHNSLSINKKEMQATAASTINQTNGIIQMAGAANFVGDSTQPFTVIQNGAEIANTIIKITITFFDTECLILYFFGFSFGCFLVFLFVCWLLFIQCFSDFLCRRG